MAIYVEVERGNIIIKRPVAWWGRVLGYAKSTFSRLHRDFKREGLTSEEFILKMIRKADGKIQS